MRPETCSLCGEEVRYGWRHNRQGWWHRQDVDHSCLFGRLSSEVDWDEVERQRHLPRTRTNAKTGEEETYSAASHDHTKMSKAVREAEDDWEPDPIPAPEVRATPIDVGDTRLPAGAKRMLLMARDAGWEATATYARGPVMHGTTGKFMRQADSVVLRARLDETGQVAVASWEGDAKGAQKFRMAHLGTRDHQTKTIYIRPANSKELAAWLKREDADANHE